MYQQDPLPSSLSIMASNVAPVAPVEDDPQNSHMMKNSRRGRPFLKDTFDLFATLIVSLDLTTHKQFFRSFPNSFTTDEAATNLASLKFSQSNRGPDPRNTTRIITTTTTTTFSMTREMAKQIAQHFMDARLIENAADKSNVSFRDRAIFQVTPKGLHVLERFIAKNGISADNLVQVFATQPICMKLLHLDRRPTNDDIITTENVILTVFRRFAGRSPNYVVNSADLPLDAAQEYYERANGVPLADISERTAQIIGRGTLQTYRNTFNAVTALEWLCDFTTIVGRDEAAEMCAHFMRYRLIELVSEKRKYSDDVVYFSVEGPATNGALPEATFRCAPKSMYMITDEGKRMARWPASVINGTAMPDGSHLDPAQGKKEAVARSAAQAKQDSQAVLAGTSQRPSSDSTSTTSDGREIAFGPNNTPLAPATITGTTDAKIQRRASMAEQRLRSDYSSGPNTAANALPERKVSNTDRLRSILDEPALRHLFREFLRGNFSEENLSFWLDVQDFKRRFHTTSSANASVPRPGNVNSNGQSAMEKHHESLVAMTFVIYNTYLAQGSACELNIDHVLRNELFAYLNDVLAHAAATSNTGNATTGPRERTPVRGPMKPDQAGAFNATQLQAIIRIYERIQIHVFRLMATDSVPKFIKTQRFLALRDWVDDVENEEIPNYGPSVVPSIPPGLAQPSSSAASTSSHGAQSPTRSAGPSQELEQGHAFLTISQAANEKHQAKLKNAKFTAQQMGNLSETSLHSSTR